MASTLDDLKTILEPAYVDGRLPLFVNVGAGREATLGEWFRDEGAKHFATDDARDGLARELVEQTAHG